MTAPGNRNVALALAVRHLVAHYLTAEGFDITVKPHHARLSDALAAPIAPDLSGVPRTWLDVSSRGTHRLSLDLDAARAGADVAGFAVGAFVQYRPGRGVGESYVILSLRDFAKLARDHIT